MKNVLMNSIWVGSGGGSRGALVVEVSAVEEFFRDVSDGRDDAVRLVGVACEFLLFGVAAEDEHRLVAHADAAEDIGVHVVADHDGIGGAGAEFVLGHAHHDSAGFTDGEGGAAGGFFDHGGDGTAAGADAGIGGAGRIRVGGDEARAFFHEADAAFDHLEGEGTAFADDHVVGIVIDDRVAIHVEGGGESVFADDEGGAVRFLFGEEAGGGHGAGEDVGFLGVESEAAEFEGDIAAGALRVVGEEAERDVFVAQALYKEVGAGDQLVAPIDYTVHVEEEANVFHDRAEVARCVPCWRKFYIVFVTTLLVYGWNYLL